ncbi:TPA: hypothetical protein ACJG8Q_005012, partial [Salmonella enterica subsp. diarizonae serovar 61:i:z]
MRYILFVFILMGGLISFNSSAVNLGNSLFLNENTSYSYDYDFGQCSANSISIVGEYIYFLSGNNMHIIVDGCDYISNDNLVLLYDEGPSGPPSSHYGIWIPTGKKANEVIEDKPLNTSISDTQEQLKEYCSQKGKCDSKGFPVNTFDWLIFKEKYEAEHNKPAENPADKPSDSVAPTGNTPVSYAEQLRRYCSIPGKCKEEYGYLYPVNDSDFIEFQKVNYPQNIPSKSPYSDFTVPEKPNISEFYSLYNSCTKELSGFTSPAENNSYNPSSIYAYNSQVDKCNAIIDKFQGSFPPGGKYSVSKDGREFVTSNFNGTLVRCYATPGFDSMTGTPISHLSHQTPPRPGVTLSGDLYFSHYLDMNYVGGETWPHELCNSVANRPADVSPDYVASLSSGSSGGSGGSVNSGSSPGVSGSSDVPLVYQICKDAPLTPGCKDLPPLPGSGGGSGSSTHNLSFPGDGHVASGGNGNNKGDGNDNGDVVAAINALHADTNK